MLAAGLFLGLVFGLCLFGVAGLPSLLRAPPLLALFSLLETGFVPVVLLASSQEGSFGLGLGLVLRVGLVVFLCVVLVGGFWVWLGLSPWLLPC